MIIASSLLIENQLIYFKKWLWKYISNVKTRKKISQQL